MTTVTDTTTADRPGAQAYRARTGRRVEFTRYVLPDGAERVLYGQRVDGSVRITDNPSRPGAGRAYLVERGLEQDGHAALLALVEDYLRQVDVLRTVPMSTSLLDRYLEELP